MGNTNSFLEKTAPFRRRVKKVYYWVYSLRSVLLAIPVIIGAIWLAIQNLAKLPPQVSIGLLGSEVLILSKGVAVLCPLAITALCLLFMFCSRRVIYPWLISLFSLVLPLLLLFTSAFAV